MRKERLHNLDIIKIAGAFAICFHHYQQCFMVVFSQSILNMVLPLLGWMVELFFMISGFLAAKSLDENRCFKEQYVKKIKRLYPCALISVAVSSVIVFFHYVIFGNCVWGNQYTVWGVITSFFMVNQGWLVEFAPAINNPIWYICVLLWLYLLYYFIEFTFQIIERKYTKLGKLEDSHSKFGLTNNGSALNLASSEGEKSISRTVWGGEDVIVLQHCVNRWTWLAFLI